MHLWFLEIVLQHFEKDERSSCEFKKDILKLWVYSELNPIFAYILAMCKNIAHLVGAN